MATSDRTRDTAPGWDLRQRGEGIGFGASVKPSRAFACHADGEMVGYRGQFERIWVRSRRRARSRHQLDVCAAQPERAGTSLRWERGHRLARGVTPTSAALTSLYYGGGATFALHWFSAIRPEGDRATDSRSTLWSDGLDVDGVLGYEFMRASAVSFFLQAELNVPAYAVRSENNSGAINTWFPGAALKLGAVL